MKGRKILFVFFSIIVIMVFFGVLIKNEKSGRNEKIIQQINSELFNGESNIERAITSSVTINNIRVKEKTLEIEIAAPDISEDLYIWMQAMSDSEYTDALFEEEVIKLLKESKPNTKTFVMEYSDHSEDLHIIYTSEFFESVSCGLLKFYDLTTQNIIDELRGGE